MTTGRMLSLGGMKGVYDILDFMMDGSSERFELLEVKRRCSSSLLTQHPQLTDVDISRFKKKNWRDWLEEQVIKFGLQLSVEAIPLRDRVRTGLEQGLFDDERFIFTVLGDDPR